MKQHSLARAAASGITKVITQNDETNAPMLAINEKLGYAPLSSGHAWVSSADYGEEPARRSQPDSQETPRSRQNGITASIRA